MEIFEDTKYYAVSFGRVRGYGEIFRCVDKTTGNYVAVKKIVDYARDIDVPSTTIRAVSFLKELNHDNIIRLLDILNLRDGVYIALEYFDLDLYEFIYSRSFPKDQLQIKNILQQILSAVAYCHSNKVVHGDLRPENFLIDRSSYIVKLANFESARSLEGLPVDYGCQVATNLYGTPEVSYSSDSAGCCLLSKMLYLRHSQRISTVDTLEHYYYFDSVKKGVKPALVNEPTEIRGSINGRHQGNESKNECGIAEEKAMKSRKDNGSENMVTSSPTVEPSHGDAQSQTLKQPVKPNDDSQNGDRTDIDSWPAELSTEPPADPHHKDECDFDSRTGEEHVESPVDPNNGSENNMRSNPREQPMDPSFFTCHTEENYVESGTMENLVSPVGNPHNQDGRIESRPTEENKGKSSKIPEMLEKKDDKNLMSDPEIDLRREHFVVPPDDPDCKSEDNLSSDSTEQPLEPSDGSHHVEKDVAELSVELPVDSSDDPGNGSGNIREYDIHENYFV